MRRGISRRRPQAARIALVLALAFALVLALAFALVLALASATLTGDVTSAAPPRAHRSAALRARDTAHLHYVSAKGSLLIDEGRATGTVPGDMKVRLRIGAIFTGSFTIYTSAGTIVGRGSAVPHGAGRYESFAGSLTATGGSGRYRNARGRAQLYGVFNRGDYSLVIQTAGTLYY
jgi:hypothetical protein